MSEGDCHRGRHCKEHCAEYVDGSHADLLQEGADDEWTDDSREVEDATSAPNADAMRSGRTVSATSARLTGSVFLVGFVGFLRMVQMLLLGAFIGALADRLDRKTMLIATNLSLAAMYVVLATLVIKDLIAVWQVSVGAFLAGIVWATDFPVRRARVAAWRNRSISSLMSVSFSM